MIPNPRRVAVIESEADIGRSPEDVFDYCSDPANEPAWNVKMKSVEQPTDGPGPTPRPGRTPRAIPMIVEAPGASRSAFKSAAPGSATPGGSEPTHPGSAGAGARCDTPCLACLGLRFCSVAVP